MSILENDLESVIKRYKSLSLGYVAKGYTLDEETNIYKEAADLISKKYSDIIKKDDIVDVLSSKGKIFTMVIKKREAFYEYRTGNIGISHFLRLTTDLLHELVHKIGYLQKDETFENMSNVFKEAGTEYVSATSFNDNFARNLIFNGIYAKFPEKTDADFLMICLVNQINQAIGGKNLEKSILKGRDYFKQAIIDRWGEKYYINLEQNITDIAREEERYWLSYEYFSEDEKKNAEEKLKQHIFSVQDTILEAEFNKRFKDIRNKNDSITFLEELKSFELNRVRERRKVNGINKYIDDGFESIFSNYRNNLEAKYGALGINFDEDSWSKLFTQKKMETEVTDEEKREVYLLATDLKKRLKKRNPISRFFQNIFGTETNLIDKSSEETINKPINNYIIQNNQTLKVKNKQKHERSDITNLKEL